MNVCLQDRKTVTRATICDCSYEGIALKLETPDLPLIEGQIVTLQGESPKEPRATNFIVDHFLKINRFMVRRIANGLHPVIGLQVNLESERYNESNQNDGLLTTSPQLEQ